ncbi:esterase-like activity of phytase family protein [Cyanobium sp. WAJ14-Wanaka]|uniref:esterase-like activity of phytase family protein n=1 Tax=Cyanobium sp. WAJ14-Wanaka TaxID=2823725 RepID=UPI0020CB9FFE|nr:esterase-like activity of phytase family protein [Cyanobium sp. WAJ14-Wanaka]MCP9774304.1 esterase-like activity of phytase family protein [Cyanobium sp. WAJ14-Wanaka]
MGFVPTVALPCPLSAGWEVAEQRLLEPGQGGGFSAGAYRPDRDELWLLSDASRGSISRWRGLRAGGLQGLIPISTLALQQPEPMDGEGLVVGDKHFWVAAEGRLKPPQPAGLLKYNMATGSLLGSQELPPAWRLSSDRGLRSNGGPESLSQASAGGDLLMAAEKPLLQDPPDRVRLLRWTADASGALQPAALRPLALPPGGWGLTDLLVTNQGLLGLWRLFKAPDQWQARLVLYPPNAITTPKSNNAAATPLAPLISWNLLKLGLAPDNWEVLLAAPPLGNGRPSLLLATDDNFNPLQRSHLARLVPRQLPGCRAAKSQVPSTNP